MLVGMTGCAELQLSLYPEGAVISQVRCGKSPNNFDKDLTDEKTTAKDGNELLESAIKKAEDSRTSYGHFLYCGEKRQLTVGTLAVGLTGGALGLASAGTHTLTAAALGAGAGTLLGVDMFLFNRDKTKAYATAMSQLQCVIEKGHEVSESPEFSYAAGEGSAFAVRLGAIEKELNRLGPQGDCAADPTWAAIVARRSLDLAAATALRDEAARRPAKVAYEVLRARRVVDVQAFASSQASVPDGAALKSAIESVGIAMPTIKKESTDGGDGDGTVGTNAVDVLPDAKTKKIGDRPRCQAADKDTLKAASDALDVIEQALVALKLPDSGIAACLGQETVSVSNEKPAQQDGKKDGANDATNADANDGGLKLNRLLR
jgi:hypothetical protein